MPRPPKTLIQSGDKFGNLTVIKCVGFNTRRQTSYLCQCSCGKETIVPNVYLTSGDTKSCGCRKWTGSKPHNLVGRQFGKWKVLRIGTPTRGPNGVSRVRWITECECGTVQETLAHSLTSGQSTSCGCNKMAKIKEKALLKRQASSCGEVPHSFWDRIRWDAEGRNIPCHITLQEISDQYERQERKCYYTGLPIYFDKTSVRGRSYHTASVDRLDSQGAYISTNIVLCHKDINRIKNVFPVEQFLHYCRLIAATHPDPKKLLDKPPQSVDNAPMNQAIQPLNAE